MRQATDICFVCDRTEPTPSMTYVDAEHPHDDRLVCDQCREQNAIDLDFVKPSLDCNVCSTEYVCFECEHNQVKEKYPKAVYLMPEWIDTKESEQ